MQVWQPAILVDEGQKVSVLQLLDAACLMDRICVASLQRGRVCGRHV